MHRPRVKEKMEVRLLSWFSDINVVSVIFAW